jgi:hypothetical protein
MNYTSAISQDSLCKTHRRYTFNSSGPYEYNWIG